MADTDKAREWLRSHWQERYNNADPERQMSREDQDVWLLSEYAAHVTAAQQAEIERLTKDRAEWIARLSAEEKERGEADAAVERLRAGLRPFVKASFPAGVTPETYKQLARDDGKPRKYPITVTDHDILEAERLLAEGEQHD